MVAILTSNNKSAPSVSESSQTLRFCGDWRVKYTKFFKGRFNVGFLKWYYDQKKKFVFPLDFKTMLTKH